MEKNAATVVPGAFIADFQKLKTVFRQSRALPTHPECQ
jgi:hypothetical protein